MSQCRAVYHDASFAVDVAADRTPHIGTPDTMNDTIGQRYNEGGKGSVRMCETGRTHYPMIQKYKSARLPTLRRWSTTQSPRIQKRPQVLRFQYTMPHTHRERQRKDQSAIPPQSLAKKAHRLSAHRSSRTLAAYPTIDGRIDFGSAAEWPTRMNSPEEQEARVLAARVVDSAAKIVSSRGAIKDAMQRTIARLEELSAQNETIDNASPQTSRSVAMRTRAINQLGDLRLQSVGPGTPLEKLCNVYCSLATHALPFPNDVDATLFVADRRKFLIEYQCRLLQELAAELRRDVQDMVVSAPPRLDLNMLEKRTSEFAEFMNTAMSHIKVSVARLYSWTLLKPGGESLGRIAAWLFWNVSGSQNHLRQLDGLKKQLAESTLRFPLSSQYPDSMIRTLSDIDSRIAKLQSNFERIKEEFTDLESQIYSSASRGGKSGALDPFAAPIKERMIRYMKRQYREEHRNLTARLALTTLRCLGYKPSRWHRQLCGIPPPAGLLLRPVPHKSARHRSKVERRKRDKQAPAPLHVRYLLTSRPRAKARSRKLSPLVSPRKELQDTRKTALGEMRRLLSSTLLSYQAHSVKSARSVSNLNSLPEKDKPSGTSQIGKTITHLGFYDKPGVQDDIFRPDHLNQAESSRERFGKSTKMILQGRPRFQATQPMRSPHPTSMSLSGDPWEQNVDTWTQTNLVGENSTSSPGGHSNDDRPITGQSGADSSNGQQHTYPDSQPESQQPRAPNEDMDQAVNDDPPSESEYEGSESEVDEDSAPEESAEEPEEEHTPLTYQIPAEVLSIALQAPAQTRASYWSQKLYRGPDDQEVLLHYCLNMEVSERVAKHFLNEKVLGFDIEWKPFGSVDSIKENASLIQLATENRIALFHVARFPGKTSEQLMPPTLKTVLESADTLKVGVAVKGDCKRLEKYFDINIRGVFELSRLHNLVEYYSTEPNKVNHKLVKLATQVQRHLLLPLYKGEPLADQPLQLASVRESDWSRPLDYDQIQYAAADAYAGFRLFDTMEAKRKKLKPAPPLPRLCDDDPPPVTYTSTKAKRAKKTTSDMEKVVAESLSGLEAEDAEEEAYETAAEELPEEEEDQNADSESALETSTKQDPNADDVPTVRTGLPADQPSADVSEAPARSIGRVNLSKIASIDPGYPTLPALSIQNEPSSDESDAFDPPPKVSRRRRVTDAPQNAKAPPTQVDESEDEFPDPELEAALATMDLDDSSEVKNNPVTEAQADAEVDMSATDYRLTPVEVDPSSSITASTPAFAPLIHPDTSTHTPEYTLATTWAQTYLNDTIPSVSSTAPSRIRATVPPLRAYHLWHHQCVPLDAIGAHLRDPPLAQSTVSSYIIQAISMEKLEYRDADMITLMGTLPANLRLGKYVWFSRKLGIVR